MQLTSYTRKAVLLKVIQISLYHSTPPFFPSTATKPHAVARADQYFVIYQFKQFKKRKICVTIILMIPHFSANGKSVSHEKQYDGTAD
jgi:hypothetical protein